MSTTHRFDPDYVVPTSEVLKEWLETNHLSTRVAVAHVTRDRPVREHLSKILDAILNDDMGIDEDTAEMLAAVTMISKRFWMSFERNYRVGLRAGKVLAGA